MRLPRPFRSALEEEVEPLLQDDHQGQSWKVERVTHIGEK